METIRTIACTIIFSLYGHLLIGQKLLSYDIEIIYSKKVQVESAYSSSNDLSDSVLIYFEEGFNHNEVELYINNKHLLKGKVTTHENLGVAKSYNLGAVKDINQIEFCIDGGKMVLIEPDNFYRIISVNLIEGKLRVQFYDQLPVFD